MYGTGTLSTLAISDSPRNLPASMHVKGLSVATRLLKAAGAGIPLTRCDQSLLMNGLPFDFLLFGYEEFILSSPLSPLYILPSSL